MTDEQGMVQRLCAENGLPVELCTGLRGVKDLELSCPIYRRTADSSHAYYDDEMCLKVVTDGRRNELNQIENATYVIQLRINGATTPTMLGGEIWAGVKFDRFARAITAQFPDLLGVKTRFTIEPLQQKRQQKRAASA